MNNGVLGIARSVQYQQPGNHRLCPAGEFPCGNGARHHHIGEQQIHLCAAFQQFQRGFGIFGALYRIAKIDEHVDHGGTHALVILHHQNALAAAFDRLGMARVQRILRPARAGQIQFDRRAFAQLAVNLDVAARLFDEAIGLGKAQTGALAFWLGGEERLEHPAHHFWCHAGAGIADRQHDILARIDLAMLDGIGVVEMGVGDFQGQLAAVRHGVTGVDRQIEDGVLDLGGVYQRVP